MAQRSDKVLHFAVLVSPGMGHLIPLVELAKWLITTHSHRVNVTIFFTTTVVSTARSQFLQSLTASDCLQTIQLPPADISGRLSTDAAPVTRLCVIVKESIPAFRSVVTAMASRPTALIVDLFCTDAFDVADELGIPKYVYITSSARLLALSLYLPTLDQEIEGEYVDLQEPIHVPGCKPVPVDDIVDPMLDRTNEQYAWYLAHASRYALAQGILLNSTEDLEPETLKALREDPVLRQISKAPIYPVGPIVRSLDEFTGQEEKECLAWLDEQPTESVLYVSLGSGGTLSNEQLTEFALGLELSQKRFVWVVRPPARKETAASFFTSGNVSCGPSKYLPEGFMTRIKGRGFFVNTWGPQTAILRHASIGGFLCHCGWNSTLESIANGVPVIAWPLYAEQRLNATMLTEDWGMAIRTEHLPTKRLIGREEIGRLVQLVLGSGEGKALRSRAKELQISALRAMGDGGSVHNSLSQFVRDCEMSLERSQQEKTPKSKEKC